MPLCLDPKSLEARAKPSPRVYSGWTLDRVIVLDCACPGLLAASLYFGPARRQAFFLTLAVIQNVGSVEVAARVRRVGPEIGAPDLSDEAAIGRAILLLRRSRDLVRAVLGVAPDGLLGAMQRLGHSPVGEPHTYHELFRLFASPKAVDRRKARVLGRMSGSLVGPQIEIVSLLDPVLLHPALVGKIYEVKQVAEINQALQYIRTYCSGATEEAIRASLARLKPNDHRHAVVKWWASRFDRLPRSLNTRGDPTLVILDTGEALSRAARRYKNCLKSKMADVLMGNYVFVEYRPLAPEPGVLIELRVTTQGFLLEGLYARGNRKVKPERAMLVRRKLTACGVALYDHAPGDEATVRATASMLGLYNFEADNTGWGVEFGDDDQSENDLESALNEIA